MARVLHGTPIGTLPEPGEIDPGDQIVAYSKDGGNAYRADVEDIASEGIDLLDKIYPVGSIYMSVNSTSPASFIGGEWTQIEDCFLLAAGSSHKLGETGGAETVTLTSSQIPSHTHSLPSHTHSLPSHTHSIPSLSGTAASAGAHTHRGLYNNDIQITSGSNARIYSGGSSTTSDVITNSAGSHTHNVTTNSSTTGSTSGTSGSTSGTSGSTGNGNSHENMPPYLTVYMWQRVA